MVEEIDIPTFHYRLRTQGAPSRDDLAFTCPMCGTVQSARTLIVAGAGATFEEVEKYLGFSCVGRWTAAGPPPRQKDELGQGCNWTLGGLLQTHKLVIIDTDGERCPRFEIASTEQAATLAARNGLLVSMAGQA